jgi:hypothetical protein
MTRDELIESLPSDLRPWGQLWLPVLLRWSETELANFIANAAGLSWNEAYKTMVDIMTTDEKIAELRMRKLELERLNENNAAFINQQRSLFFSLLAQAVKSFG